MKKNLSQLVKIYTNLNSNSFIQDSLNELLELLDKETYENIIQEIVYIRDNERLQEIGIPKIAGIVNSMIKGVLSDVNDVIKNIAVELNRISFNNKEVSNNIANIKNYISNITNISTNNNVIMKLDAVYLNRAVSDTAINAKEKLNNYLEALKTIDDINETINKLKSISIKSKLVVLNKELITEGNLLNNIEIPEEYISYNTTEEEDNFTTIKEEDLKKFYATLTKLTNNYSCEIETLKLQDFIETAEEINKSLNDDIKDGTYEFLEKKLLYIDVINRYTNNLTSAQDAFKEVIDKLTNYLQHIMKSRSYE